MTRFHISQDETSRYQLTYEANDGELTLISYDHNSPKQLVDEAMEMAESGEFGRAIVVVDPTRRGPSEAQIAPTQPPAPRKAGE